jgi:hypothetical protein
MNRATTALALIAVAILFHALGMAQADGRGQGAGRYMLFHANYEMFNAVNHTNVTDTVILRIDTYTGTTFKYSAGLDADGKYFERWIPVMDDPLMKLP